MSTVYPFPTNVLRVFPSSDMEVLMRDTSGSPASICLTTHTVGDRAIAQVLLAGQPDSFVLFDGARYFANGTMVPCNPAHPSSIAELRQAFDMETVEYIWPGPRPRVYIFTHTLHEWEDAKAAVRHLVAQKLLSSRSYIESDHTGEDQGLSAQNLDATPHSAGMVALFREAAYCTQNDLSEKEVSDEDEEEIWPDEAEERDEDENSWEDDWDEEDDDPWEDEPYKGEEDNDTPQAFRDDKEEEAADGALADAETESALVGTLALLRRRVRALFSRGLDWRQALARYTSRIVVCQHCHAYCHIGFERAERLCHFHLYTCGLGAHMEAAQYRLVTLLARQATLLQAHTTTADALPGETSSAL